MGANSLVCTSLRQPHPLDLRSLPHFNCSNSSQVHYSNVPRSESKDALSGDVKAYSYFARILMTGKPHQTDFDFASKKSCEYSINACICTIGILLMPVYCTSINFTQALYSPALLREAVAQNERVKNLLIFTTLSMRSRFAQLHSAFTLPLRAAANSMQLKLRAAI